jgi:Zn finger protein HypA/HybF involved in hydrogenase expression
VDLAAAEAERIGDVDVGALRVRIGDRPMSAIVHDACRFSFNVAALVTPVEGARLDIQLGSDDEPALTALELQDRASTPTLSFQFGLDTTAGPY